MRYKLEKVIITGDEWDNSRKEEFIASSDSLEELKELAKTIPLKGGRYLREHLAITEHDEYGDIIDYVKIIYADKRKRHTSKRRIESVVEAGV